MCPIFIDSELLNIIGSIVVLKNLPRIQIYILYYIIRVVQQPYLTI